VPPRTPAEPPGLDDGSAAAVLDEAEDILNAIGAQVMAEVEAEQAKQNAKGLKRFFRRRRKD
jgi:GAF domain-containing protein